MILIFVAIIIIFLSFYKKREPFESKNAIFVFSGNARSFLQCIDSCYEHVITKLFKGTNTSITVLFYLKLNDPKHPSNSFVDINRNIVENKLNELKKYNIHIESIILDDNEIKDIDILSLVKDREKYIEYLSEDENLIRSLHCHYNFEACGKKILTYQKENNIEFDTFIYIRPDLFFTEDCKHISQYSDKIVTAGISSNKEYFERPDHCAIIPKKYFYPFFFGRMELYKNNTTDYHVNAESVYLKTIDIENGKLGDFYIKRD